MTFIIFHYFFFLCVFLLNKFKIFPTLKVIASEFLIAALLPIAFPPIVIDAINAVTNNTVIDELILNYESILLATSIPALPLTTPHTSPITSLHIEASLSEFFKSITECLLPFTFFDAIE